MSQLQAKMKLGEDLPGFGLEMVLPGHDLERHSEFILDMTKRQGLPWRVVHAPFVPRDENIYDTGVTTPEHFRRLKDAAVLARELSVPLVVHDDTYIGFNHDPQKIHELKERKLPLALQNLRDLSLICPAVMIENLTGWSFGDLGDHETVNLFSTEGSAIGELAKRAGIGVTFDVAHSLSLGSISRPRELACAIGTGVIRHVHLSSFRWFDRGPAIFAEGLPLDQGILSASTLSDLLDILNPDITVTLEVSEPSYTELPNTRSSITWLRRNGFI